MAGAVEGADRFRVGVGVARVDHRAVPERVVGGDHAARPHQREATLEIKLIVFLVGVDEGEVESAGAFLGDQRVEGSGSRPEPEVDLVGDAGLGPMALGDLGPFVAAVERGHAPRVGQGERDRERAVAGEDADFETVLRPERAHEELHERALVGRNLHPRLLQFGGFGAKPGEDGMLAHPGRNHVIVQALVEGGEFAHGLWPLSAEGFGRVWTLMPPDGIVSPVIVAYEEEMTSAREKTLSYRRAGWFNVSGLTLERCLKDAHNILKGVEDRTIIYGDQYVRSVKHRNVTGGGLLVHLTGETPGEATSVVPKVAPGSAELDLKTAKPPSDGEWLDGDAFLFVKGDNVCVCATGFHDAAIRYFLYELFKKAKLRRESIDFELLKVADISKVKMLHSQGVKELEIRAELYKATADYVRRRTHVVAGLGAAGKHLKAFLKKPDDVTPDGLKVILTIKTDKRFGKKSFVLGERRIEELATDVVKNHEQADDYVIVTKTGQRITPMEIFMKTKVEIESDGKTVNCEKAWEELVNFFKYLNSTGALEQ